MLTHWDPLKAEVAAGAVVAELAVEPCLVGGRSEVELGSEGFGTTTH